MAEDSLFYKPEYSVILDAGKGKDLLKQCSRATPEKVKDFWAPANEDIEKLNNNFKKILKVTATECCIGGLTIKKLEGYVMQYIGVTIKNKKYIYINAFSIGSKKYYNNWEQEPAKACDGGAGFWGALFDLEDLAFTQLSFNGIG